jgi:hypothetical protein
VDQTQRRLLTEIERAFAAVQLGDGVSLHETEIIDGYGSAEERQAARAPDEKSDWRKVIDDLDLTRHFGVGYAGLCFLDGAGVRFYLPACLSRAVRDHEDEHTADMVASLLFLLTSTDEYTLGRLAILNNEQRACVREVLIYLRGVLESGDGALDRAIDGYWIQRIGSRNMSG